MRWLVDGYNVVRRAPDLASAERVSLEMGRAALCRALAAAAANSGDEFTVVWDGARGGGVASGGPGVRVVFSSARERADDVLVRMARQGGAVVTNDRAVRQAAVRAGAIAVTTDEFLVQLESALERGAPDDDSMPMKDEDDEAPAPPRKGNPRRLGKKARRAARVLRRLGPGSGQPR